MTTIAFIFIGHALAFLIGFLIGIFVGGYYVFRRM